MISLDCLTRDQKLSNSISTATGRMKPLVVEVSRSRDDLCGQKVCEIRSFIRYRSGWLIPSFPQVYKSSLTQLRDITLAQSRCEDFNTEIKPRPHRKHFQVFHWHELTWYSATCYKDGYPSWGRLLINPELEYAFRFSAVQAPVKSWAWLQKIATTTSLD